MRIRRLLPLALAAAALPGCYAARAGLPLDASGMDLPVDWAKDAFADQCRRTADRITGFPDNLRAHFRESARNLSRDPGDF